MERLSDMLNQSRLMRKRMKVTPIVKKEQAIVTKMREGVFASAKKTFNRYGKNNGT